MIKINGTAYRLCLLDTNVISAMVKEEDVLSQFIGWALGDKPVYVPCFSPFTVLELRRRLDLFEDFTRTFETEVPACFLLKGYEWLLEDEVAAYPDPSTIDPTAVAFTLLGGEGNRLTKVYDAASEDPTFTNQERHWNENAAGIVEGVTSLVANYPPSGAKYTRKEAHEFVFLAGLSQIAMRQPEFMRRSLGEGEALDIDSFPSVKAMTYTVFHKFHVDPGRKAQMSDAFDLIIASAIPYVDAVVIEAHQAEVLKKTKSLDDFIDHVEVLTLRDFAT